MREIYEFRRKFFEEHGDKKDTVPFENYWLLFKDGHKLAADPDSAHWEPAPISTVERLDLLLAYFTQKQKQARKHFLRLKLTILATFCGARPEGGVEPYRGTEGQALRELQHARVAVRAADHRKQNVAEQLNVAMYGPNWREVERLRRRSEADSHQKMQRFAMKINDLKV